ncbi:hypothetical protein [Pantoea sp. KPR_PJ]|uniref:hypothetical protein n=1 Tax=Pantoea sp. KPR_PJ TaxID=2738375 RepID=UPI003528B869
MTIKVDIGLHRIGIEPQRGEVIALTLAIRKAGLLKSRLRHTSRRVTCSLMTQHALMPF